jgi:hypothetical protein
MTERTTRSLEKRRDRQARPMDWAIASGLGKTLRNNLTGNSGEPAECRPIRVTRAEDLDSLDSILGPARGGTVSESRPIDAVFSSSIFSKVRKRWGQSISPTSSPPASAGSTSLEYLQSARSSTLISRHDKDARSTTIKDTGPLSLARSLNAGRRTRASSGSMGDIFRHVPNESLCMLLPLWPGETDLASALRERAKYKVSLQDRSYLLVYYVPFDKQKSAGDPETRVQPLAARPSHAVTGEISAHWKSFAVCASLLSHEDIYGSRARLPDNGLAITGPVSDALKYLPSKESQKISADIVIAVCYRREMGIELNLEGLTTLGLCVPMTDPFSDPGAISLTPVGRAVAEMTWLGAIALTSFGV